MLQLLTLLLPSRDSRIQIETQKAEYGHQVLLTYKRVCSKSDCHQHET